MTMTFILTEELQTELSCLVKLLSDKQIQNPGKIFNLSGDSASMSSFGITLSPTFSVLMIGELPLYNYTAVKLNAQNFMTSNTECCYSSTSQRIHRGSGDNVC